MSNLLRRQYLLLLGIILIILFAMGIIIGSFSFLIKGYHIRQRINIYPELIKNELARHFSAGILKNGNSDIDQKNLAITFDPIIKLKEILMISLIRQDGTIFYISKDANLEFLDEGKLQFIHHQDIIKTLKQKNQNYLKQSTEYPHISEIYFLTSVDDYDFLVNLYFDEQDFLVLFKNMSRMIYAVVGGMGIVLILSTYLLLKAYNSLRDKQGQVVEELLVLRTKKLAKSEKEYRALINEIKAGMYIVDDSGILSFANKQLAHIFGYDTAEEIVGKNLFNILSTSKPQNFFEEYLRILKQSNYENEYLKMDGINKRKKNIYVHIYPSPIFKDKQITGSSGIIIDNTQSMLLEQISQRSEHTFRALFEKSNDAIIITDKDRKILEWNDSAQKIFGYSAIEMIGQTMDIIIPKDLRAQHKKGFASAVMKGVLKHKGKSLELPAITKNGKAIEIELSVSLLKLPDGLRVVAIIRDITERKANARKLQETEERFRTLVQNIDGIVFIINNKGKFELSEGKGLAKLNLLPAEVVGKSVFKLYGQYPKIIQGVKDALIGKTARAIVNVNGVYWDTIYSPFKDISGKIIGVEGVSIDVTAQMIALEKIRQANKTNFEILKNSPVGIILFDQSGNPIFVNEAMLNISGDTAEQIMKINAFTLRTYKKLGIAKNIKKVFKTDKKISMPQIEYSSYFGKKRSVRDFTFIPIKINGQAHVLMTIIDVTERIHKQKEIEKLNILRNKFIKIVSHQLRTPLNAIRWNTELLLSGDLGKLDNTQRKIMEALHESEENIIERINDLLVIMDIEEGRIHLEREKTSLVSLFNGMLKIIGKETKKKKIIFEYKKPLSSLSNIDIDASKIRDVIMQLLQNAIGYTKAKGKIMVKIGKRKNYIRFSVIDTGIGIPQVEQDKIFTQFYRASNAYSMVQNASGIGLTIAKYYVEQHGGNIGFKSEEDKGSTFWFELPIA